MIWVMFSAWAITAFLLYETWQYVKRWEGIAGAWEYQSTTWERLAEKAQQDATRWEFTAEMWQHMYQGERNDV